MRILSQKFSAMNSTVFLIRSSLIAGIFAWLLGLAGCATQPTPEIPGTLKVAVNVPPSWSLLLDSRISEAFTDRVREVFHQQGFDRPVEEVTSVEDCSKMPYLLTINLTEWRINHIGNIDCTFSASLRTPQGTRHLGLYTNTTMRWLNGLGRFGLADSFDQAAEGAIQDLWRDVEKSDLLTLTEHPARLSASARHAR
jgi:hypothetical protein